MQTLPRPPAPYDDSALDPRVARSRAAILSAALEHFLQNGYIGANVDDIAAEARVSKRTIYNIFGGKEQLFREVLSEALAAAERFAKEVAVVLADTEDLETELKGLAVTLARTVVGGGRIVRVRRLLIGEAERFPELASNYYERAPGLVMDTLARAMRRLNERGLLEIDDPRLASEHFAFLVLGAPLDRALFAGSDQFPAVDELDYRAIKGVEVFLRAYRSDRCCK